MGRKGTEPGFLMNPTGIAGSISCRVYNVEYQNCNTGFYLFLLLAQFRQSLGIKVFSCD